MLISFLLGYILYLCIGTIILATLDTKDLHFYKWLFSAPSMVLIWIVITFWFVLAIYMIIYRIRNRKEKRKSN